MTTVDSQETQGNSSGQARFDHEVDVLVIGSGAGGMVAALTADAAGRDTLVIEKSRFFGGSTARSGGGAWVPNAPALVREGQRDDPQTIIEYLETLAGDRVSSERIARFVEQGPLMMEFLEGRSPYLRDGFFWIAGYPDYHPEKGGNPLGRGLWARPIDRRLLGDEMDRMRPGVKRMQLPLGAWITSIDLHDLLAVRWGGIRHKRILLTLAKRILRARVLGERMVASGAALSIRLRLALRERGIPLWLETPMLSIVVDADGRAVGVESERDGRPFRIRARDGIVLATGGFDHNLEMRKRFQPGIDRDWSLGSPENLGDGHVAAEALGAATDLMEEAWWMPTMEMPDGTLIGLVAERQYPGQFVVNSAGRRFVNEASPYVVFVQAQLAGHAGGVSHVPSWMIVDSRAWKRNIIAGHFPGTPLPRRWVESGIARTAPTIEQLAVEIGVPPDELRKTADRFNQFARQGRDEDFGRGDSTYDRYYGDPSFPNPNLTEVSKPPFYAFALTPGDLGTKGGVMTDVDARVLREDGSPIPGLYAAGNVAASVMGTKYAGPGATLGPAMTFAYIAARHIAESAAAAGGAERDA
jgi:succinate dehydrogenase/fumarate reductase flavoprotein subunit